MTNSFARASFQAPAASGAAESADPTTYQKVKNAPEVQSGERLLVEAYAAIWIVLFALILLGWWRQRRIDARITDLEAALARARAAVPAKKAGAS